MVASGLERTWCRSRAVFETYWGGDKHISQDAVLTDICKRVGVDPQKFFAAISEQSIKDQLKEYGGGRGARRFLARRPSSST